MVTLPKSLFKKLLVLLSAVSAVLFTVAIVYLTELSSEIQQKFDGKRWSLPAVVYARPLELYPHLDLSADLFEMELQLAGYRQEGSVGSSGGYSRSGERFELITREFSFPSGKEQSKAIRVTFSDNKVSDIIDLQSLGQIAFVRLDPARIGSFHPLIHEDRLVLEDSQVPEMLQETLMAVEDKKFLHHHGISISGIARAMFANIRAGRTVQGGSTLTQQLVKNFFLNRDRTLSRKIQEALMAILLEFHYSKKEIMTAYVNEVFLGQDGSRAIHGFGLASQYYFRRELQDLSIAQIATLAGMVKGPSLYNPISRPDKCKERRGAVLRIMLADGIIDEAAFQLADRQQITDVRPQKHGFNRFPAFLELVRRQIKEEYKEDDLKKNGLQILTNLDPQIQLQAEKQLRNFAEHYGSGGDRAALEGAVVVTGRENGEVHAIVGGMESLGSGFNRALDAKRPIGSLIKPAVYLTALSQGYNLASPLQDKKIELDNDGKRWRPKNYDQRQHGVVPLYRALAESYNLATVRLGMDVGVNNVAETLKELGFEIPGKLYPSLLLGAVNLSPLQVSQVYQTIASGGFYVPIRSIRAVLDSDGKLLRRYGLKVEQRFATDLIFLLNHCLERVVEEGTAQSFPFPKNLILAGKTGTTNDFKDSWFAGYSSDRLGVVWLGNDDNRGVSLTGSSGALRVWGKMMLADNAKSVNMAEPQTIKWKRIDSRTLRPASIFNSHATVLPYIDNNLAEKSSQLPSFDLKALEKKARDAFDNLSEFIK